jgi:hypothetical protein
MVGVVFSIVLLAQPAWSQSDHVISISVDGLSGTILQQMLQADPSSLANFRRFVDEGATTFNARTDYTHTNTLPNHTSMITGRPVLQPAGQSATVHHGYTNNGTPSASATLHNSGNPGVAYIASVFDVSHDNGMTTALYTSKSKFIIYDQSYGELNGADDATPPDHGRDKIDTYIYRSAGKPSTADPLQARLVADLASAPARYSFVHYRNPDSAGHAYGWGSGPYGDSIRRVDAYLGEVFQAIAASSTLRGRTTIILTADHGGSGTSHSNAADPAIYTIPFFAWGAGVQEGADLYALNEARRADPGSARPDYNVHPAPIRNGDAANLALHLLGLPPVPGSSINADQLLLLHTPTAVRASSLTRLKGNGR